MDYFSFYIYQFGYPVFILLFVVGSGIHLKADRNLLSAGVLMGFTLMLAGNLLQNYGPSDISYSQDRTAHIQYTWLFTAGHYASGLGMLLASACYLLKAMRYASCKST